MIEFQKFEMLHSESTRVSRSTVYCPPSECCGVGPVSREVMFTQGIEVNSEQRQPFTFPIQRAPPPGPVLSLEKGQNTEMEILEN